MTQSAHLQELSSVAIFLGHDCPR